MKQKNSAPHNHASHHNHNHSHDVDVNLCAINGEVVITEKKFQDMVQRFFFAQKPSISMEDVRGLPVDKLQSFFHECVKRELITREEGARGIEEDPEFLRVCENLKALIKVDFFHKKIAAGIVVSDADVEAYFNNNPEEFKRPVAEGSQEPVSYFTLDEVRAKVKDGLRLAFFKRELDYQLSLLYKKYDVGVNGHYLDELFDRPVEQ